MKIDSIISTTACKFISDNNIFLEDWQKAWLFYNSGKSYEFIWGALCDISNNTEDSALKNQITNLIELEKRQIEAFKSNDGNAIYIITELFPGDDEPVRQGTFASYELAESMASKLSNTYTIEKVVIAKDNNSSLLVDFDEFADDTLGYIKFFGDGSIRDVFSREVIDEHDEDDMFYERYFDFEHPFKVGDIVKKLNSSDRSIGIIANIRDNDRKFANLDHSDAGIYVSSLDRDTGYLWDSDEPENPYLFEHYPISSDTEDIAEQTALELSNILKGNGGSLQFVQDGCQYLKERQIERHKKRYISGLALNDKCTWKE